MEGLVCAHPGPCESIYLIEDTNNMLIVYITYVLFHQFNLIGTLEILREDISILYKSADRPNVYNQRRLLKEPVDVM